MVQKKKKKKDPENIGSGFIKKYRIRTLAEVVLC